MNNQDDQQPMLIPAAPAPSLESDTLELEQEIIGLRAIVFRVVIGLLLLTMGVNVFIWRQTMIVRAQLADQRRAIEEYQKAEPAVRDLMKRLQAFAVSNPDFRPIIAKYAMPTNTPGPGR